MKLNVMVLAGLLVALPCAGTAWAQATETQQPRPTDQQLSDLIATRIANDKAFAPDAIKIKVENGVVTLSGMVARDADKGRAEELARVPGVVRVQNNLVSREKATDKTVATAGTVADATKKGAAKTKKAAVKTGEVMSDAWITGRIKTKFAADDALRASAINVDTKDHVVTLTGAVPNTAARDRAIAAAKEVEGVKSVVDKLQIADRVGKI